ncbi:nitrate reductase cytochrome c550-type subunit [Vibrio variabilis]|uniref:Nitrate reductase cytochrome c550-type subunit n=1 Tax=Vibrio variabilis TaxID=990271 RepID=A0ABQ0JNM9_9VIBR|nr:nitrate reductase cytochrome c550-type subunit [Vibrio variabilis]
MKKLIVAILSVGALIAGVAQAELNNPGGTGGLDSLRGSTNLEDTRPADDFKHTPKDQLVESSYVYQPPLIPHQIRNYEVCLTRISAWHAIAGKMRKKQVQPKSV